MTYFVGLGNPGKDYDNTRHNAGWIVLDALHAQWQLPPWWEQSRFVAEVSETADMTLLKPLTYMNDSGQAVRAWLQFYDKELLKSVQRDPTFQLKHVWVLHDDLDLELGKWKIQLGVGPKIHNGLGSLYQELGTKQFWHVRIGVDSRRGDRGISGSEYVLRQFSPTEKEVLQATQTEIIAALEQRIQVE